MVLIQGENLNKMIMKLSSPSTTDWLQFYVSLGAVVIALITWWYNVKKDRNDDERKAEKERKNVMRINENINTIITGILTSTIERLEFRYFNNIDSWAEPLRSRLDEVIGIIYLNITNYDKCEIVKELYSLKKALDSENISTIKKIIENVYKILEEEDKEIKEELEK